MEESFGEIDRRIVRDLYRYAQTWGELSQVLMQQVEALGQLINAKESGIWFTAGRHTAIVAGGVAFGQSQTNRFEEVEVLTQSLRLIGERIDHYNNLLLCTKLTFLRPIALFRLTKHTGLETRMRVLRD